MLHWIQQWGRNLQRFKLYTIINIAGLSLGISGVIAIYIYVTDELSYDDFHLRSESIFRINTVTKFDGSENRYFTTSAPLADAVRNDVASVEYVARLFERQASLQVTSSERHENGKKFREDHFFFGDPSVFDVLTFIFLKGDPKSALKDPSTLVISRSIAEKYFGSVEAAIGQDILFEGHRPLTISGIIENYPLQSHLQIELLAHFELYYLEEGQEIQAYLRTDWLYNPILTYVVLKTDINPPSVEDEINALKKKYADERVIKGVEFELQPLRDIHLHSNFTFSEQSSGIRYVYILISIGLLILCTACINFVNLSNVHSLKRAKEIGVRKALGARRKGLMWQFFRESSTIVMISFAFALIIVCAILPFLNDITDKHFTVSNLTAANLLGGLAIIFILTAFLAGLYPSFYATRFNPAAVLKGLQSHRYSEGFLLRKILLVFQFTVSVTLVVMGTIFYRQMEFVRGKSLGFQREHMLTIPLFSDTPNSILGGGVDGPLRSRMNVFENELQENSEVEGVTLSSNLPGSGAVNALVQTDKIKPDDNVFVAAIAVDYDFPETYKMQIVAGRNFSSTFGTDHLQAFIINEQAVKTLGWEDAREAIGQPIELLNKQGTVIGVIKDFHYQGLQQPLRPLILEVAPSKFTVFTLRLQAGQAFAESIEYIKKKWDKVFPERVFEYHFLDDRLELNYGSELRLVTLMEYFAGQAMVISALGLFGLAAYMNHLRAREVSIRKVLGANIRQVFYTLSKEFFKIAVTAFFIAVPLVFIFGDLWLNSFAYTIPFSPVPFVVGGLVVLFTVAITVGYETIKTARLNPIDNLRDE